MTYQEVHEMATSQVGPICKNCPVCNGRACGNSVPGPGSKAPGNTAARNYDKWQEICVNIDTISPNIEPDVHFDLFGRTFKAPIFAAPIGAMKMHYGDKYDDIEYNSILVPAAYHFGLMSFTGDTVNPAVLAGGIEVMATCEGIGCPTIKPWNKEAVMEKVDLVNKNKLFCCAMDVDAAGLPFLKALNPNAGNVSVKVLEEIIDYAKVPFIVKGIMTANGARKAVDAGAKGIVVSNHGGRVQGGCPSTCEVLPEIARAVRGKATIFVDGGIRSGVDVFRALALGADAVLIGRPVVNSIYGAGEEGFDLYIEKIIGELKSTMSMCGVSSLGDISRDNVRI